MSHACKDIVIVCLIITDLIHLHVSMTYNTVVQHTGGILRSHKMLYSVLLLLQKSVITIAFILCCHRGKMVLIYNTDLRSSTPSFSNFQPFALLFKP